MTNKIDQLLDTLNSQGITPTKKSPAQETKDQFLQMLIAQLKNQDPLNPLSNDRFAVDLATFSQLEQLISINEKLGTQDSGLSFSASLLGKTVVLNDQSFKIQDGILQEGIFVNLPKQYDTIQISLLDASGNQVYQGEISEFRLGRNLISLDSLNLPNGEYSVKISGKIGGLSELLPSYPAVTVYGFIPGAEPVFIAGDREISLKDIAQIWSI